VPDTEIERAKKVMIAAARAYLAATDNAAAIVPIDAHRFVVLGSIPSISGIVEAMGPEK
jgi:hypothetical protein